MTLNPGSSAINAGSNAAANAAGLTTDQRGFMRVANGTADIGAFEFIPRPPQPAQPAQPAASSRPRGLGAFLEKVKVGRKRQLRVVVRYADTGEIKMTILSPYSRVTYRNIVAAAIDTDGDGTPDSVEVTAQRYGQKRFLKTRLTV